MSTIENDLLVKVIDRRIQLGVTQEALAAACGLNQGHLSKVLAGKLKLAAKTRAALRAWLVSSHGGSTVNQSEIQRVVELISRAPAGRQIEIMQLLRILDRLAR